MEKIKEKLLRYVNSPGEFYSVEKLKGGTGTVYILNEAEIGDGVIDAGVFYLKEGASIGSHEHGIEDPVTMDVVGESYEVLDGTVEINGERVTIGGSKDCPDLNGDTTHDCVAVGGSAIVGFVKYWI